MIAISGDHRIPVVIERGLEPDGDRFLPDIQVAEAADQAEPVQLARALFEPADEQHLFVEAHHLVGIGIEGPVLVELFLQGVQDEILVLSIYRALCLGGGLLRGGFLGQVVLLRVADPVRARSRLQKRWHNAEPCP